MRLGKLSSGGPGSFPRPLLIVPEHQGGILRDAWQRERLTHGHGFGQMLSEPERPEGSPSVHPQRQVCLHPGTALPLDFACDKAHGEFVTLGELLRNC